MTDLAVIDRTETIAELTARANYEHSEVLRALGGMLGHAIACGKALIAIRETVPLGTWKSFVRENLDMGYDTVTNYCKVAQYETQLTGVGSFGEALGVLRSSGMRLRLPTWAPSFDLKEAQRLRAAGMTYREIAATVGGSESSVKMQLSPKARRTREEYDRKNREAVAEYRAELYRRKVAAELERVDAAVKKTGGSPAHAYALLRKTAQTIDRAMGETSGEQREALRAALAFTHKAEDEIVKALGISRRCVDTAKVHRRRPQLA